MSSQRSEISSNCSQIRSVASHNVKAEDGSMLPKVRLERTSGVMAVGHCRSGVAEVLMLESSPGGPMIFST